jgi:hypothetical protein
MISSDVATTENRPEDVEGLRWLADAGQDIRYVCRTLTKSPGFGAAIILTLALGIGVNTAVFSVINAVLLRPLSYPDPDRIVMLMSTGHAGVNSSAGVSPPKITAWRESTTVFTEIAAYTFGRSLDVTSPDHQRRGARWARGRNWQLRHADEGTRTLSTGHVPQHVEERRRPVENPAQHLDGRTLSAPATA